MTALTEFQVRVARIFFGLPESAGFLIAGGAALIAHHLINRPTRDLDLFTSPRSSITDAVTAFEAAIAGHGWTIRRVQDHPQFACSSTDPEDLIVDIGVDAAPQRTPTICLLGPSYDPLELAARKLLALFDRAEARDFTDVHALVNLYGTDTVLATAQSIDPGLTPDRLAEALASIHRFTPGDFPIPSRDVPALLGFYTHWQAQLEHA